jgi:[protein-PII] uridylyltransferase
VTPGDEVSALIAARRRLGDDPAAVGTAWLRGWTAAVDGAVSSLAAPVLAEHRIAVVAIGGYGRAELAPGSDVDLLLLHDRLGEGVLADAVRRIVYPLWDAGLDVGHVVRDRREALDAVSELASATAMLDQRLVAGDAMLAQDLRYQLRRRVRHRPEAFLRALRAADLHRRTRHGDTAEQLEPDLKRGPGGLRDLQSLRWAAVAIAGVHGLDPMVAAGYVSVDDPPRLARAERRIQAARVACHLVDDGGDVLRVEMQEPVATRLGFPPGSRGAHEMLTEILLATRRIDHAYRRAWALLESDIDRGRRRRARPAERQVDGFELVDGVVRVSDEDLDDPTLPHRLLEALVDTGALLDRRSAARLRRRAEASPDGWGWTDDARRRTIDTLWRGRRILGPVAELDDVGALSVLLPEWTLIRGRPQRNPYHRFTLDRHAWNAVAEIGELVAAESWAAAALRDVDDPDGLLLAALLHDVGKIIGEPHDRAGGPLAERMARRTGASDDTVALVGRLTRLHLLLAETARRADVTDPAVAGALAEKIGDHSTLACLHLLTVADGRATGRGIWSAWTAELVARLVQRVGAVLDGRPADEVADGHEATRTRARVLAGDLGADPVQVVRHLDGLPDRYAATLPAAAVVVHAQLVERARDGRARAHVSPASGSSADGLLHDRFDVVATHRPGWFSTVVGIVSGYGGDIAAADAFATADAMTITSLRVAPPVDADDEWWDRVRAAVSDGRADSVVRRRTSRSRAQIEAAPPRVRAEPGPDGATARLEVRAADRPGLLHRLARTIEEVGFEVVQVRALTTGREALDVFVVRDRLPGPFEPDRLAALEAAVLALSV